VPGATVAAGFNTQVSPLLIADGDVELNNASMTFELSGKLDGVSLAAGKDATVTTKPGASFQAGLQVHNNADTVAHGTAVIFDTDWAFQTNTKYSNCFYDERFLNACVFDQDLAAGRSYSLSVPYRTGKDTMAPGGAYGEFEWLTADDYNDFLKLLNDGGLQGPGVAGTGGKLELQPLPALKSLAKQSDPDEDNNWQTIDLKVAGKQGVDLAARFGRRFGGRPGRRPADHRPADRGRRRRGRRARRRWPGRLHDRPAPPDALRGLIHIGTAERGPRLRGPRPAFPS
jgi:hypothetical protein